MKVFNLWWLKIDLGWFEHAERRYVVSIVKRIGQMEISQTTRGRRRPRKTIEKLLSLYLD